MADKLIFPIGFDLESGLKTAESDLKRVARQLESAIKKQAIKVPVGLDEATAKKLREEAKDIERVLANIKNNYGSGQLKGLSIGFINTQKEIDGIKKLETQLQALKAQRTSLVNAGATIEELNRIDAAIRGTELRLKILYGTFNKDQSSNVAISQQIVKLKQLAEELAGIDRMYARMQASAAAANKPVNSYEVNEMLARRREIMEEITRVTKTATEAQKELFNIKGVGVGASQGIFGVGGEQALSAITAQISRYEELQNKLREVEGEYERLKAMQAQGMGDQSEKINQTLQRRIAIQKELGEITQTAAQAQKKLEKEAQATAAAFQRGRGAIENFNRVMKLPENRIMNIQQKINLLNQALKRVGIGSAEFNKIARELTRLSRKLDEAKAKQEAFAGTQKKVGEAGSKAFREQSSYLNILIKRLAVYTSLDAVMGFLTKVREVTAQFELQRISLGAIINDQARANQLFNEIKQFALKSPIKILDLTKYTKQLAAFRFETDTLFDTTKRVADISVGLSVPMDRLILALGHVKASTYLTGITLRQFSMAGIPMLELLAERFSELEGRAVSTTDVLKRVHDKMVSFEDVNQIFINLTSSGGMFYNMQEKQGNTLYGMWAKLGDAASVMYDQIGNTTSVNSAMKGVISGLTDLMRNWRSWGKALMTGGAIYGVAVLAMNYYTAAVKANTMAVTTNTVANIRGNMALTAGYKLLRLFGVGMQKATAYTMAFSKALKFIGAISFGVVVAGLTWFAEKAFEAYEKAHKLKNELKEIQDTGAAESAKNVFNFQRLANAALEAANGSKEQKDALDELKRTYKDIIPSEQLSLENLRKLREQGYEPLTAAIKEYIAQRTLQKEIDAITSNYTEDTIKKQRDLREFFKRGSSFNFFRGKAWSPIEGLDDDQISQVFANVEKIAQDKSKKWEDVWVEAIKGVTDVSEEAEAKMRSVFGGMQTSQQVVYNNQMRDIVENTRAMATETDAASKKMESQTGSLGKYKQVLDETSKSLANIRIVLSNGTPVDTKSFLYSQMLNNASIKAWKDDIVEDLKDAGVDIRDEWFNIIEQLNAKDPTKISAIDFEPIIASIDTAKDQLGDKYVPLKNAILKYQELYNGIVPTDRAVQVLRAKLTNISNATGVSMDKLKGYWMNAGESIEDYAKRIKDAIEEVQKNIMEMNQINADKEAMKPGSLLLKGYSEEEIKQANALLLALQQLFSGLSGFTKSGGSGRTSDPRLNNLKEEISLTKKLYDEYKKLEKQIGATKAAEKIQEIYSNTIKTLQQRAGKYGFTFELPFTDENLKANMQQFINKMKELQKLTDKKGKPLFPNIGKDIDEAVAQLEDVDFNSLQKALEQKLKDLSDKISRTKTAKEFYDKILSQTGSYDIAGSVTMSIYGDDGQNLLRDTVEQLQMAFENVDISAAIDLTTGAIDYNMLRKFEEEYSDKLIAGRKDLRDKLISEGEKASAAQVAQWYKDIEKAKDYNQQYVDIVRETQTKIAEIRRSGLDKDREDELVRGMEEKQRKALKKLQLDEFRSSDLYVRLFEDMDSASTTMLQSLKDKLDEMKKTMREDLTPKELKSLTQDIEKLEDVLQQRNPFKTITDGLKGLRQWHKENGSLADAEKKLTDAIAEEDAARKQWEADTLAAAKAQTELNAALQQYQAIVGVKGEDSEEAQTAKANADAKRAEANAANDTARKSEETYNSAKQTKEEAQETVRSWERWLSSMREGLKVFGQIEGILSDMTDAANNFMDVFAASDETRQFFDDILGGLNSIIGGAEKAATGMLDAYAGFMSANPMQMIQGGMSAISGLSSIAKGVTDIFYAGRIKRANKEIKRQQKLLEQLQYTYSRLEKSADNLFGRDYINNYNQQLKNLQAQAEAYQKQAEAEKSKGKKKDKEKIKEYENAYRDTMDELADMQSKLSEKFLGSDLAGASRDFAKAWIDAYKEVGRAGAETTKAMKEQFQDMVENMVVEGALAAVMQKALQPMFDMIDNMNEQDFYNESFWKKVAETAQQGAEDADKGAQTLMKFLEQAGISIKDINTEYTGIKRDIAGASEETMSNVATIGNTLMYYVSPIPGIAANVALLTQHILNGNASATTATTAAGWTDWQQQAMDHYAAIQRNTADTVVECRRAAQAAENAVAELQRVIKPRRTPATHSLHVTID